MEANQADSELTEDQVLNFPASDTFVSRSVLPLYSDSPEPLKEEIGISHFVTGAFTDIYSNQDWIHENLGFSVLYLLETFAGEESPTASLDLDN